MVTRRLLGALGALALGLSSVLPLQAAESSATHYYPASRHLVSMPFAAFVDRHGVDFLGPPLTPAYLENGHEVQWFQNGRLEVQDGRPVLTQLGTLLMGDPAPPGPPPADENPEIEYFPQTGHGVGYALLRFYRAHGGPEVLGFPLGPQIGNEQWFGRAKLVWDPAQGQVRLGELGPRALAEVGAPPGVYEPLWVGTHRPSEFRTGMGAEPETVPSWRAFLSIGQEGQWLRVWDPLTDRFGYIEFAASGPIDPPGWHAELGDVSRLNLPGRAVRVGSDTAALEDLRHNDPIAVRLAYTNPQGETVYLTDKGYELPERLARVPRKPDRTFTGKWIDADLREPVMVTAYEDDRPVYSALAVKGTVVHSTPLGVFQIQRRVENETMDSSTIGIPRNSSDGYYLEDVLFTQYFTSSGAALHYNYWRSSWGYAGSHGCLGMNYADSKFFWDWADIGTTVYIHN